MAAARSFAWIGHGIGGAIAAAILWLTSAESSFVTGTAIAVDGGATPGLY